MLRFEFKLNVAEEGGFWVSEDIEVTLESGTKEIVSVNTQGDTMKDLYSNVFEAVSVAYEKDIDDAIIVFKEE